MSFAKMKFVTLYEMDLSKVLTSFKLNNVRLVIRVSDHNREDIARRDTRKSLVDPKKYFNVDEREGYAEDSLGVPFTHYGRDRILSEFKEYLSLLNSRSGANVYDDKDLEKFINSIFDARYKRDLEKARKRHSRI